MDSDDEWQSLADATDLASSERASDQISALLRDVTFMTKLKTRLQMAARQVREARVEGASKLRSTLRVVMNLLASPDWSVQA